MEAEVTKDEIAVIEDNIVEHTEGVQRVIDYKPHILLRDEEATSTPHSMRRLLAEYLRRIACHLEA